MNRRRFLRHIASVPAAGAAIAAGAARPAADGQASAAKPSASRPPLVGIQMGPHTMLDEGIEPCLDLIQRTAGINAVLTYSHAFHGDLRKDAGLAPDHGKPPR